MARDEIKVGCRIPEIPLPRHPYSQACGDRKPEALERLRQTLAAAGDVGEITTLDGAVISDWDMYVIAVQMGMAIRVHEYAGDDPGAAICAEMLHGRGHHAHERALVVVTLFPWTGRGRPKKTTHCEDFSLTPLAPQTAGDMAALADCCVSLIEQAKDVVSFGRGEAVRGGQISFAAARKAIKLLRDTKLAEPVLAEECTFAAAYREAADIASAGLTQDVKYGRLTVSEARRRAQESAAIAQVDPLPPGHSQQNGPELATALRRQIATLNSQVRDLERKNELLARQLDEVDPAQLRDQVNRLEERVTEAEDRAQRAELMAEAAEEEAENLRHAVRTSALGSLYAGRARGLHADA